MPRIREKAPRRGRPARRPTAVPVEMRSHILDHAEALFALHGLYGVTVREVARSAAVDPALGLQCERDVLLDAQLADDALGTPVFRGVDDPE